MSVLKQGVVTLVILAGAGYAWLQFDPAAVERLEAAGIAHPSIVALAPVAPEAENAEMAEPGDAPAAPPRMVVTATAGVAEVNDRLSAIGDGQAIRSVDVTPYVTGTLVEIFAESGQRVETDDVIARLDDDEQIIAVERAVLALEDAENILERRETLRDSSAASVSGVDITEAELAVQTARLQLREAELNLSRRAVRAPIDGIVGIVSVNTGDYVTTETEIARIDDRSELLVDFWVPERFASVIEVGQPVTASAISNPDMRFDGEVRAVDSRIDLESRTLWVRAAIPNENDQLRAGMAFSVGMNFDGDTYPTVDPLSVQWSAEGSFVWRVRDGKTERVPVRIVQRNSDSVLVEAAIVEGDPIITEGLMQLRPGASVMVAERDAGDEAAGIPGADTTRVADSSRPSGS